MGEALGRVLTLSLSAILQFLPLLHMLHTSIRSFPSVCVLNGLGTELYTVTNRNDGIAHVCQLPELRRSLDMFIVMMKAYPHLQQITETNQSKIEVNGYRTVGKVGIV